MIRLTRVIFLIVILSLILPQLSYACSCLYRGKFTEYSKGYTVVRGKIKSHGPKLRHGKTLHTTMNVTIAEVVTGFIPHSSVEFTGDPGDLCLSYVDSKRYPIGSEHLFAVFSEHNKQELGGCGEVSVSIVDGKVHGAEMGDKEMFKYSIDYDDFIKTVKAKASNSAP